MLPPTDKLKDKQADLSIRIDSLKGNPKRAGELISLRNELVQSVLPFLEQLARKHSHGNQAIESELKSHCHERSLSLVLSWQRQSSLCNYLAVTLGRELPRIARGMGRAVGIPKTREAAHWRNGSPDLEVSRAVNYPAPYQDLCEGDLYVREESGDLERIWRRLQITEAEKWLLNLRMQGYARSEVSEVMEQNINTLDVRWQRLKAKLRKDPAILELIYL